MTPPDQEPTQVEDGELAEIEARANAARNGPWEYDPKGWNNTDRQREIFYRCSDGTHFVKVAEALQDTDGAFIARARTDIPKLIGWLRRSEAARIEAENESIAEQTKHEETIGKLEAAEARCAELEKSCPYGHLQKAAEERAEKAERDRDEARMEVERLKASLETNRPWTLEAALDAKDAEIRALRAEAERKKAVIKDTCILDGRCIDCETYVGEDGNGNHGPACEIGAALRSEEQAR